MPILCRKKSKKAFEAYYINVKYDLKTVTMKNQNGI